MALPLTDGSRVSDDEVVAIMEQMSKFDQMSSFVLTTPKHFASEKCKLCKRERLHLVNAMYNKNVNQVNQNLELYRGCRHNPNFPSAALRLT